MIGFCARVGQGWRALLERKRRFNCRVRVNDRLPTGASRPAEGPKLGGAVVPASSLLAHWDKEIPVNERLKVSRGGAMLDAGAALVAGPHDAQTGGRIEQGVKHPLGQSLLSDERLEFAIQEPDFVDSLQDCLSLDVVRAKVEAHPRQRVALGLPGAGSDLSQNRVVGGSVSAQELLDAAELRGDDAVSREHERLQNPSHPAIAVAERVNHDQVQMRHGCPYEGRFFLARLLTQQRRQLADEGRDEV